MAEARWLEVSLTVDDEMAEAVAEVLGRFVSQGVVLERSVTFLNDEDEGTPDGPVRVYGYLVVDEHVEENRQRIEEALWHLGQIRPLGEPAFRPIEDQNWMAAWKEHYRPIPIGQKLLILPAWIEQQDSQRVAVKIDPSMAFGTGTHPTTQLCMQAVETYVQPGQPVIDVGCGSGILSIAALKLNASHALAVDIDPAAVLSTKENAAANGVSECIEVGQGSVQEVLEGQFSIRHAPLVLANILAPVLIRLFQAGLAELVMPAGVIVLSGVLDTQAAGVIAAAEAQGLHFVEQLQMADWVAIVLRR
ncbi:MAG: 50S ribosomal protein L11 methyltransferase [Longilinea sp.]|nr:50S ribosomal protein L11 methyltransferase [Longilinea sp.]MCA1954724.1 50S ribosomal protein L11 methyltransferase [Anaerolinea sp.]